MKPKLWIFDVDGTLIDSLSISYDVDKQIIKEMGGNVPDIEEYRRSLGEYSWNEFYNRFGVKDVEGALSFYYAKVAKSTHRAIPGARNLLQKIVNNNIARAVVSINESQDHVISRLRLSGLDAYFTADDVYCETDNKTRAIKQACSRRNIAPENALYIGDTAKDVREARTVGVRTAAISNRFSYNPDDLIRRENPDYLITDIFDLVSLLEGQDESN